VKREALLVSPFAQLAVGKLRKPKATKTANVVRSRHPLGSVPVNPRPSASSMR
jgi:hypothetical protein